MDCRHAEWLQWEFWRLAGVPNENNLNTERYVFQALTVYAYQAPCVFSWVLRARYQCISCIDFMKCYIKTSPGNLLQRMRPSWISEWHSLLSVSQGKYQQVLCQLKQIKQRDHEVFNREGGNVGASRLQHYYILLAYPECNFRSPGAQSTSYAKGTRSYPG